MVGRSSPSQWCVQVPCFPVPCQLVQLSEQLDCDQLSILKLHAHIQTCASMSYWRQVRAEGGCSQLRPTGRECSWLTDTREHSHTLGTNRHSRGKTQQMFCVEPMTKKKKKENLFFSFHSSWFWSLSVPPAGVTNRTVRHRAASNFQTLS